MDDSLVNRLLFHRSPMHVMLIERLYELYTKLTRSIDACTYIRTFDVRVGNVLRRLLGDRLEAADPEPRVLAAREHRK